MNYIKKLKLTLFFIICFACLFIEASASAIKKGEYIAMGNFDGNSIVWRCIGENENGYYFLCDKVLGEVSFDPDTNLWRDSSVREYLNNNFIIDANFSEDELGLINTSSIKSVSGFITEDTNIHIYDDNYTTSLQNIEEAFGIETQDRFFLPSVGEINLLSDLKTFGADYYMGKDILDNYKPYYLRDAVSFSRDSSLVRYVSQSFDFSYIQYNYTFRDKLIRSVKTDSKRGLRPAFYLGDGFVITGGSGSKNAPYKLTGELYCTIKTKADVMFEGDYATPEISCNSAQDCILKYYCNGVEYDSGEAFKVEYGNNKLYAVAQDTQGNILFTSKSIIVKGIRIIEDYSYLDENFDGTSHFYSKFSNYAIGSGDNIEKVNDTDASHGKSLCFTSDKTGTYINTKVLSVSDGILVIKTDVKFSDYNFSSRYPFDICVYKDGSKQWLTPLKFYPDKTVKLFDTANGRIVYTGINLDEWYRVTLIIDVDNRKLTAAINNDIVAYNESITEEFDYISYINYSISSKEGKSQFFFDNIKIYSAEKEEKAYVGSISVKNNGNIITDKLNLQKGNVTISAEFEKTCVGKKAIAYALNREEGILYAVDSVILDENNLSKSFTLEEIPGGDAVYNIEIGLLIWEKETFLPVTKRIIVLG